MGQIPLLDGNLQFTVFAPTDAAFDAAGAALDAQIVIPDVFADNGVIHAIDWVLLP